jgi:ribosomal protein S27E
MGYCTNKDCDRDTVVPDDVDICPDCGSDVGEVEVLHALVQCVQCGEDNSSTDIECWNCGTTLVTSTDNQEREVVCAGCGRPRSALVTTCPSCGNENLTSAESGIVLCEECGEPNGGHNRECWSCGTIL